MAGGVFKSADAMRVGVKAMGILGIDTVAIVVADRRKAIAWYRDALGLEVAYIGPNDPNADPSLSGTPEDPGHWIELGPIRPRTRVHLCEMGGATEPGPTGITFLTDDIQGEYERMRAQGVAFLYPPKRMEWGEWLCEFEDPDGNVFDLKQPQDLSPWDLPTRRRSRPRGSRRPGRRAPRRDTPAG